ncbi:MAG TPA: NAD(P)-dependent alcohol dehydrogenase [Solirubrobacteraceae bacterium]|nr:NAD(P)-dependent alcohol dehydrogenase [Solirubrobacteraceae bacterium]
MDIQAAVTESKGAPFEIRRVSLDDPRADEILVRVAACGICHTDLIIRDQWYPVPLPAVLGHEGAGVVEAVGSAVSKVAVGDHVAMSYGSCGRCVNCQAGEPWVCHDFFARNFGATRPDGSTALRAGEQAIHSHFFAQSSFAGHAIATERNVVKLDPDVPLEVVAPFGCGIQTGAGAVLRVFRPEAGASIAVFGVGTVGLAAVMAARVAGCTTIIGVDVRTARLDLASDLGATHVVDAGSTDAVEAVMQATGGIGADFSIDATGSPEVLRQAVYCTGPGGVCGLIGAPPFGTEVSLDTNLILAMGRTVRGIVEGQSVPDVFLPRLIELWRQGRFPVDRIMTHYAFSEIEQAARDAEEGKVVKPVLRMDS